MSIFKKGTLVVETKNEIVDPTWLHRAKGDLGLHEIRGGEAPRIIKMFKHTTLKATEDEVPWCAAALCCWLEEAGLSSPKNAWAQSFAARDDIFNKLSEPAHGCICVYRWNANSGHVNIHIKNSGLAFGCIGGNQLDPISGGRVSIADYSKQQKSIIAYLWPKGYPKS